MTELQIKIEEVEAKVKELKEEATAYLKNKDIPTMDKVNFFAWLEDNKLEKYV